MWSFLTIVTLLSTPFVSQAISIARSAEDNASNCCTSLVKLLPGKVVFPGAAAFEVQLQGYYSAFEESLVSSCRVSPANAQDVSDTLGVLSRGKCKFAVRSGGHMFWPGAANIAAPGITIDMKSMSSISLSKDKKTVSVGPGASWGPVLDALAPFNLTAVGGRSNTVGLGGFLLGGGFSNLSPQHGFGNDNIVNYEIVLATGQIIQTNKAAHPDLFWALKAGSTNFGIVTRYDISTFSGVTMWGGYRGYKYSQEKEKEVSDAFLAFMVKLRKTPLGGASFTSGFNAGQDSLVANLNYIGADGSKTDLFSDMLAVTQPTLDTLRTNVNQQNLSAEIDSAFPPGLRTEWATLTFKANTQLVVDISAKGREVFAPFLTRPSFSWNVNFQSLPVPMLAVVEANPNPQGLSSADGDLLLVNLFVYWADEADDKALDSAIRGLIGWATETSKARGLWNPWLYLNYALPDQPVYAGFGKANVARLKQIQRTYDRDNVFGTLWSGGFKL